MAIYYLRECLIQSFIFNAGMPWLQYEMAYRTIKALPLDFVARMNSCRGDLCANRVLP